MISYHERDIQTHRAYGCVCTVVDESSIFAHDAEILLLDLKLDGLMQTASVFHQVHGSLAFLVRAYAQLTEWKALVNRLRDFGTTAGDVAATSKRLQQLDFRPESEGVALTDLDVISSDGTAILKCVSG